MPRATATRTYGGRTGEDRRTARRQRLLAAGLELLGTEGHAATTVRGTCRAARLTPRYFYESFDDLDAFVTAVFEREVGEATAHILSAYDAAPDDAHAKARAVIDACVRHLTDDPRRARVLFTEGLGDDGLARRRLDTMHAVGQLIATMARHFYGRQDDDEPIAELTGALLIGGFVESVTAWLDGRLQVDREQLVEDLTELWVVTGEGAVAIADRRASRRRSGKATR
jgi:AcrR family transcriptional regulator